MDLYRLQSASELANLGLDDYLAEPIVAAIEWGERFEQELPSDTIQLHFTIEGEGRRITIKP
jgi:tRNA A37 threonylcarbamoyladenosine biosynthesis protein TsaE